MKRHCFYFFVFLLSVSFISCSEETNFNQIDELEIRPSFETSIFYVKVQELLINRVSGANFFTQDFNFDAFEQPLFSERVIEGAITYELENTTSKQIEISIDFLDNADGILYTESFSLSPAPSATLSRIVAFGATGENIDIIRNTSKIRLSASTTINDSTSSLPDPSVVLKSSAQFTLEL